MKPVMFEKRLPGDACRVFKTGDEFSRCADGHNAIADAALPSRPDALTPLNDAGSSSLTIVAAWDASITVPLNVSSVVVTETADPSGGLSDTLKAPVITKAMISG